MDFLKAFDSVPHRRLLGKLHSYGIRGQALRWIESFLTGRQQRVAVRGTFSGWTSVLSGIPQGSVLGPVLFVIYINDLPDVVLSELFMFADDTKIFREIRHHEDQAQLQADLKNLQNWSEKWLLIFHPDKCKVMNITRKKVTEQRTYIMKRSSDNGILDHPLKVVKEEKDLGVTIDNSLTFRKHISMKVNKANQMMGLIRRSFVQLDGENFRWLFKAIVRPHLEYLNAVWYPWRKLDMIALENVQRRATKMIPGFKNMSYPERLRQLELPTLKYRRLRGDMIETYKIITGIYDPEASLSPRLEGDRRTRGHRYKLLKTRRKTRLKQHFFLDRITNIWNNLPDTVVSAPSVAAFERRLDRHWAELALKFDFEADIVIRTNRTPSLDLEIED